MQDQFEKKKKLDKNRRKSVEEYNNTRHSVTGFAPNHLLYGKMIEIIPKGITEKKINLKRDRKETFKNSARNFEINKQNYDKKDVSSPWAGDLNGCTKLYSSEVWQEGREGIKLTPKIDKTWNHADSTNKNN